MTAVNHRDPRAWLPIAGLAGLVVGLAAGPVLGASAAPGITAGGADSTPQHTISVTGSGHVFVTPDTADVRLGVLVQRPTVANARADAAASMTAVLAALKKAGIADKDIQTSAFSLQPVFDYSQSGKAPRITGYELRNGVSVTVRNLDNLGPALDAALAAGATTLDSLSLRVADPATAQRQAREQAVADAKAKADTLAKAAATSIIGVASISESVAAVPWPTYREALGAVADKAATPIEAGTTDVEITVNVVYLIP
jgi:uncharacterized protein YggE